MQSHRRQCFDQSWEVNTEKSYTLHPPSPKIIFFIIIEEPRDGSDDSTPFPAETTSSFAVFPFHCPFPLTPLLRKPLKNHPKNHLPIRIFRGEFIIIQTYLERKGWNHARIMSNWKMFPSLLNMEFPRRHF